MKILFNGTVFQNQPNDNTYFRLPDYTVIPFIDLSGVLTGSTGGGTVTTANNGLTLSGTRIRLGGTLTGDTTINTANKILIIGTSGESVSNNARIQLASLTSKSAIIQAIGSGPSAFADSRYSASNTNAFFTIQATSGSTQKIIGGSIVTPGIKITDSSSKGLYYNANYSTGFTSRSLVDKAFVTGLTSSLLSSTITGATSGLRLLAGNKVALGGTYTGATILTGSDELSEFAIVQPSFGGDQTFSLNAGGVSLITPNTLSITTPLAIIEGSLLFNAPNDSATIFGTGYGSIQLGSDDTLIGGNNELQMNGGQASISLTGTTVNNIKIRTIGKIVPSITTTRSGINVGNLNGDVTSNLANGDVWYNTTTHNFRGRWNGATASFINSTVYGSYTGATNTRITTVENNYVTGYTSLGGSTLLGTKSGKNLRFKGLVAGTNITLTPTSTGITISSSGSGSGTITGATNGLRLSGGGKKTALGGIVTGSTTIGLGSNNITFTASTGTVKYGSDLSGQYNVRSLVDKGFVTGITSTLRSVNESLITLTGNTTLDSSHAGKIIQANGTFTITLPNGMTVGMPVTVVNIGTGVVTFTASGTLNSKLSANKLVAQWGAASFYYRTTNTWVGFGDLTS